MGTFFGAAPLFAADGEVAGWAGVIAAVANIGFAGAVAWYLLTKALPGMQDKFTAALKEQQAENSRCEELRRAEGKAGLGAILEHCEREGRQRSELYKVELSLLQKQIQDHGEILEEVRDRLLERDARRTKRRRADPPPQT